VTDAAADAPTAPRKGPKLPLILGVFLALAGVAGGFLSVRAGVFSGVFAGGESQDAADPAMPLPDIAFVEVDPIIVSLPDDRVLRFRAQLEVTAPHVADVQKMMPRVVDVMNGYLRALEPADFQHPAVLPRLRGQLLRRAQVVVGDGRVRDVLIMEFVLS
jgi:flagellar FliL protein